MKKSHFLGVLKRVSTEEEAKEFITAVKKKHYDARHNCFAMRIGRPGDVFERSGDDGEPSGTAGKPMLDILKGAELYDVCAVVTRYFGGTLLGTGGLVRAYSDSLKEALSVSEISAVTKGEQLEIVCSYSDAEKIKRLAANMELHTMDEIYAADCTLLYIVPDEKISDFEDKIVGTTLGRSSAKRQGEVLYYGIDDPIVYSKAVSSQEEK